MVRMFQTIVFLLMFSSVTNAQITIEDVKATITFDGITGNSLRGLCDVWYAKALQSGMTKEQAATLALDSLGSAVILKMGDLPEMIKIDGGGGKEYVPEIIGPFSGKTTRNSYAIRRSALDCITCIDTLKKDTINVEVLCLYAPITTGAESIFTKYNSNVRVEQKRQERTFAWQTRWEFQGSTDNYSGTRTGYEIPVSRWNVIETKYLDPIEGCYKLIPIENND